MTSTTNPLDGLEVVDEGRCYYLASYCGGGLFTAPLRGRKFIVGPWTDVLPLRDLARLFGLYVYATRSGAEKALAKLRGGT